MTEKILAILFVFIKSVIAATGYGGIAILDGDRVGLHPTSFRIDHALRGIPGLRGIP